MDTLTSTDAAERLGVNPQRFHRLVAKHAIAPAFEATGIRGIKLWNPEDIDRLAELLAS